MMWRDERRFRAADRDGDLIADREEFTAFLHPEDHEHMKNIVVQVRLMSFMMSCDALFHFKCLTFLLSQETIEDIDKNGDGFIDLKEYIGEENTMSTVTVYLARRLEET